MADSKPGILKKDEDELITAFRSERSDRRYFVLTMDCPTGPNSVDCICTDVQLQQTAVLAAIISAVFLKT